MTTIQPNILSACTSISHFIQGAAHFYLWTTFYSSNMITLSFSSSAVWTNRIVTSLIVIQNCLIPHKIQQIACILKISHMIQLNLSAQACGPTHALFVNLFLELLVVFQLYVTRCVSLSTSIVVASNYSYSFTACSSNSSSDIIQILYLIYI